jgi:hypothetical protein
MAGAFTAALDDKSPPGNALEFASNVVDFLESNGVGFLAKAQFNIVCLTPPADADAVAAGFTGLSVGESSAATIKEESESGPFFMDPRCDGQQASHSTRRTRRMLMWNMMKAGFVHHQHLLSGVPKGDFHAIIQGLKLLAAADPCVDLANAVTKMVGMSKAPAQRVDFGRLSRDFKEIQQVLVRPRDGNYEVGDQVAVLFFVRCLEGDPIFRASLELFHQKVPLPSLPATLAFFAAVAARMAASSSPPADPLAPTAGDPLAFTASFRSINACFAMKRHGHCPKGDTCKWNHDPLVVANASMPPERAGSACLFCQSRAHSVDTCSAHAAFQIAMSRSQAAPVVARMALPAAVGPVVARMALPAEVGPIEIGCDFDLQDVLANYELSEYE